MKMNHPLLGSSLSCTCGKTHTIIPHTVYLGDDIYEHLPILMANLIPKASATVALLADTRTQQAAGQSAEEALRESGWDTNIHIVPDSPTLGTPKCDEKTKNRLAKSLTAPDIILAIGAGVISDLGKWLAAELAIPYVSLATAASMNGYASANVAPTIDGVKSLVRAHPPEAVITAPAILRAAPYTLTTAGLGDILAKSVSSVDWFLNHLLFGEYYCPEAVGLIDEIEPYYLDNPEGLRAGEAKPLAALFQGLILTGVAMTMAESSAPASGAEHLISHILDMRAELDQQPADLHGRQVGVGTILTAALYERVLATENPTFGVPSYTLDTAYWGTLAPAVATHFAAKQNHLSRVEERLSTGNAWDELRAKLVPLIRPVAKIRDCLARAGAAYQAADIGCTPERLTTVFRHAHEIRARFTVIDLAWRMRLMPEIADELVGEWV